MRQKFPFVCHCKSFVCAKMWDLYHTECYLTVIFRAEKYLRNEKVRVSYGHHPLCSCGGLGDPSGPHTFEFLLESSGHKYEIVLHFCVEYYYFWNWLQSKYLKQKNVPKESIFWKKIQSLFSFFRCIKNGNRHLIRMLVKLFKILFKGPFCWKFVS